MFPKGSARAGSSTTSQSLTGYGGDVSAPARCDALAGVPAPKMSWVSPTRDLHFPQTRYDRGIITTQRKNQ